MKERYIVAGNAFTVSAAEGLSAWEAIRWRFSPFAGEWAESDVLAVDIKTGPLPECDGESIYDPAPGDVGFIDARALRRPDGSLIMVFKHADAPAGRLWMMMSPELDRADIVIASGGDDNDSYFLAHALMIAYMLSTSGNGTLLIHSSAVVYGGKAYLFQGKSGTGKSTHASMWLQNIDGAEQLNDDNPIIRFSTDGTAMAYGSPWSGKTPCYRNVAAPIGGLVRIVRSKDNELRRLAPLQAYASLTTSVLFLPFVGDALREARHKAIERLVGAVPVCEMYCRPDADAAFTCMRAITRG